MSKKEKIKEAEKLFYSEVNATNILKLVALIDEAFKDDEEYMKKFNCDNIDNGA